MPVKRKELSSEKVLAGSRTYFFDVKESADGIKYLVISETRRQAGEKSYEHNRVMVFQEYLKAFNKGFKKAVESMNEKGKTKAYDVEQIRSEYREAYTKWTAEEEIRLIKEYNQGKTINELAEIFQRSPDAIRSRLE